MPYVTTQITEFTNIPYWGMPDTEFVPAADHLWTVQMPRWVTEVNTVSAEMNTLATDISIIAAATWSAANDYGQWSALSGPISQPALVQHNGEYWVLQQDMAEVSNVEPGTDEAYWKFIFDVFGVAYVDVGSGGDLLTSNDIATPAEYLSATPGKVLGAEETHTTAIPVELTAGANVTIDMSDGLNFYLVTTGDHVLDPIANPIKGFGGTIEVIVSDTAHTVTFSAAGGAGGYVTSGGVAPDLSASVNGEKHVISYSVLGDEGVEINARKDVRGIV